MEFVKKVGLAAIAVCVSLGASAIRAEESWTLDNEGSSLSFVTTKLDHVPEAMTFKQLSGALEADGSANLEIAVDSLDALVEIRDGRMKEHLFKMVDFPSIDVSAQIDMGSLAAIATGDTAAMTIETTLILLGTEHQVPADVLVTKLADGLIVSTQKPVLLNAKPLGLAEGIAKLAELAGGIRISEAVPVSFSLRFD